jgi:hypothetical protein
MAGQPYPFDGEHEIASGEGEVLLAELSDDLDVYAGTIPVKLAGEAKGDTGVTVRVRVRLGGTPGLATDGTVGATADVTGTSFAGFLASGTPANPTGNKPIKLTAQVVAGAGNASVRGIVVSLDPLVAGADVTDPVVVFSPPDMTQIAPGTTLHVTITDNIGLRVSFLWATFASGHWEVVHDGDDYSPIYSGESTRDIVPGGFAYHLKRRGGWPSAPTIRAKPIDLAGNEPP